jgi:hypothetical protein
VIASASYDTWLGLRWNLNNLEQVAGFLFISFSFCWVPFIWRLSLAKRRRIKESPALDFFTRSSWFVVGVIVITTFVGGIYNEIRLLHLLSPWIIVLTIDFISEKRGQIAEVLTRKWYWFFSFTSAVLCGIILFIFLHYQEHIIVPGKFAVPYHIWIISSVCYIFILLLSLPITLPLSKRKSDQ